MLVVKIEFWRHSKGARAEAEAEEIGRLYISNVGGTESKSDYEVRVCRRGSTNFLKPLRTGTVEGYARNAYNVWRLVLRGLKATFPEEK